MAWTILALRRLRTDLAPTIGVLVLVLVTALLAALAPRVLAAQADHAVRGAVDAAPVPARNITVLENGIVRGTTADDPLGEIGRAGLDIAGTFPPRIRSLIRSSASVVEGPRFRLTKPTTDPAFIRLRIQEGIDDHIQYVEGHAPTATVTTKDDVGPEALDEVPVYEVGVSSETARRFGLALGDEIQLRGDPGDPLLGRTQHDVYAYGKIAGVYDVPTSNDDYWFADPLPIHPVIRALSLEVQLLDAVFLVDPAVHERLVAEADKLERPLSYQFRYRLDSDRITARSAPGLAAAFRRLNVLYPSPNITPANDVALRTGLLPLLDGFSSSWAAAQSVLAVTALGPALVAIATLALISILAARRRRATMTLARSRGATGRQVLWPVALEGLLIAVPAAVIAAAAAVALVAGGRTAPAVAAAGVVVAVAVAVVVATVVPIARSTGATRRAGDPQPGARAGGRRLVLELLVVGLAVAGAWLLRERGLATTAATATGRPAGFDPLIAAVPALVGIAAGIVAVRLYPVLMRGASAFGRRRRGLVALLATRRAADGGAGSAVLLVLLATATVGAFAAVSLDNLDRGADLAAWQAVGADYRIEAPSGGLPASLDPAALPGAEAVASQFQGLVQVNLNGPQVLFAAVEGENLRKVLAGTPAAPAFPPGFATPGNGPIPAIVSRRLVDNPRGVQPGETFHMTVQGYDLEYRADAVVDDFPGLPPGRSFVVAAREQFLARAPEARIVPTQLYVRAPPSAAEGLREHVTAVGPSVTVTSQAEDAAARRASPVTGAVRSLILVAALVTAGYAALGVAAALALSGLARTQETAHLRTLGLTGRQAGALLLAEHGPITLAAFVAGGLLGAALFALLRPAMGIGMLVGAPIEVPVVLEPALLVLILIAMLVVVGFGLWLGAFLQRRVAPTAALRGRFE